MNGIFGKIAVAFALGAFFAGHPMKLGAQQAGPKVLDVDAALSRLAIDHPRQAQVVEMRFFGGLTNEEIVEALRTSGEPVSLRTVERDWRFSRAWLQDAIGKSR